jgi:carbon storage regulator
MLVLSRKPGEKVRIGSDITLAVLEVSGNRVRIGLAAPARIRIARQELYDAPSAEFVGEAAREVLGDLLRLPQAPGGCAR